MKQKQPIAGRHREATHVFSKEIAAQVRRIELRTKGLVESLFSGEYHSMFKGRGLEFSDVREYQPGDDVRAIDWNVTARRGHLFMKEYVEERQLAALLIVELSFRPSGRGTRLSTALEYASRVLHRRSAIFLVSDFLLDDDTDPQFSRAAGRVKRDHDLVPIRLTDQGGAELPNVGLLALVDPETGERLIVDTGSAAKRRTYADGKAAQRDRMTALFRELRMDTIEVSTTEDYVPALIRFFRQRERVSR
jgi:uncharacterized protein (DUF58 family)